MENGIMEFSLKPGIHVRSNSYEALISHMEQCNDLWAIKDHASRFIYVNKPFLHYNNLPKKFNIEGRLDSECPAPWSEIADIIQANDSTVMQRQKSADVLTNFIHGRKEKIIQPFLANIVPLIQDGKSIGIIGRAKKLDLYSMYDVEQEQYSPTGDFDNPDRLFTDREFEVVFLALQSLTMKEIANKLDISSDNADKYMQSIYQKTGVSDLPKLKNFCMKNGYHKFAPYRYNNPKPYIPLNSCA